MTPARLCVLAAVCAVLVAPSTARAEPASEATEVGARDSSPSEMPSPWLGIGLVALGAVFRRN